MNDKKQTLIATVFTGNILIKATVLNPGGDLYSDPTLMKKLSCI